MPQIKTHAEAFRYTIEHIMDVITNGTRETYSRDEVLVILASYRDDPHWNNFMRALDKLPPIEEEEPPEDS